MEDLLQFSGNQSREKTAREKFERTDSGLKELDDQNHRNRWKSMKA